MLRAIELNGVAVDANKAAFSLGRLAAADPAAASELLQEPAPLRADGETLDALIERSARFLVAYQNAAYAERYRRTVAAVRAREQEVIGTDSLLPLTRAVAEQLRKLMAYKDEYEVGRLYTDGEFEKAIADRFEGDDLRLEFYMAPPALVKPKGGTAKAPKKVRFGPWLFPLLKLLARAKALRGTAFDPFGRSEERRLERRLIAEYEARVAELAKGLAPDKLAVAVTIANVPAQIRGYGHVKLASLAIARARESELLNRFDPERYPRPAGPATAGQFRGIPVTSA